MPGSASVATLRPANARASVTNDPRRLRPDIDMRSNDGRRFADLFDAIVVEHPDAGLARVREIALLKFGLERGQSDGICSLEDVVRISNLISRRERDLRQRQRDAQPAAPEMSFAEKLAAHHAERGSMTGRAKLRTASNPLRGHSTSSRSNGRFRQALTPGEGVSDADFAKAVDRWLDHKTYATT